MLAGVVECLGRDVQTSRQPEVAVISVQERPARALGLMGVLQAADPALKVIFLLGRGAAGAGVRGMEMGASDCLPLPLDLGVLIDSLRAAVSPRTTPGP